MVKLYTWCPATPGAIIEHAAPPDLGHSAVEVVGPNSDTRAYASFWPELDSMVGRLADLVRRRQERNPVDYAQEIDPAGAYLQRPADYVDQIDGLNEGTIVDLWELIRNSDYDFMRWNCSNVSKLLLLSAMDTRFHPLMAKALECTPEELTRVASAEDLLAKLRYFTTSPFIDCRPEDLRRIAETYAANFTDLSVAEYV